MAATTYTKRPIVVENTTLLPKTAAKIAAALLVLQPYPYVPGNDFRRPQAKVFAEPEVFAQAWKSSPIVITASIYNPAKDAQRLKQAKVFSEPEVFAQAQTGRVVTTLALYATVAQQFAAPRSVVIENVSRFTGQKGTMVVLSQTAPPVVSADVFISQDLWGWPLESFEPPTFPQNWRFNNVVRDSFPVYNFARDFRRPQSKLFLEPESFISPWRASVVVVNSFTPYNFRLDVRRQKQTQAFTDPEVFHRPLPFNELITNGSAPIIAQVPQYPETFDIYDYLNGSILIAWGPFFPHAQSYNVYVTPVGQSPPILYGNTTGLQMLISGLTITTYNPAAVAPTPANGPRPQNMPPTGVVTPAVTYDIKIVAVVGTTEEGLTMDKQVTPGPVSIMLKTPMKRPFPFPNTGSPDG